MSISGGPPRTVPERDADPTRGLAPPPRRTPETEEGKQLTAARKAGVGSIFQGPLLRRAVADSFSKLDPRVVLRNPVVFYDSTDISTPMTADLAANVAVSFSTTTTWQPYAGESTMSYTAQMVGLAAQNFLAGAAGLAIGIAFIRGLAGRRVRELGNFWVDTVRATLWVLLPIALVGGILLVWQGVPRRADELAAVYPSHHVGGWLADVGTGAGRRARVDREPGHQWRRLLQCQWGAPLPEPDPFHQSF